VDYGGTNSFYASQGTKPEALSDVYPFEICPPATHHRTVADFLVVGSWISTSLCCSNGIESRAIKNQKSVAGLRRLPSLPFSNWGNGTERSVLTRMGISFLRSDLNGFC
jgi:hypothetical protein